MSMLVGKRKHIMGLKQRHKAIGNESICAGSKKMPLTDQQTTPSGIMTSRFWQQCSQMRSTGKAHSVITDMPQPSGAALITHRAR
jgi:hypothetical protein